MAELTCGHLDVPLICDSCQRDDSFIPLRGYIAHTLLVTWELCVWWKNVRWKIYSWFITTINVFC